MIKSIFILIIMAASSLMWLWVGCSACPILPPLRGKPASLLASQASTYTPHTVPIEAVY